MERLRSDRAVAGVASGLARYLNIDVAWVRIAFVVGALFGGTGILLYLVGWIAMPEEGEQESIVVDKTRNYENAGSWIGIGLIVVAAMIVIGNTGLIDGDLIFAGVLVVLGFLLYRGELGDFTKRSSSSSKPAEAPSSSYATITDQPTGESQPVADTVVTEVQEPLPPAPFIPPTPPPPPDPAFQPRVSESRPPKPRESSALGRLALATMLIVVGVMGVGQSAGWWEPAIRHYVGAIFVVIGAALVTGAIYGRARWLIVVGVIAAPMLFGAALLDVPLEGGFGDPHYSPASGAELESEYRLIAGELVLDLTDIELAADEVYEIDTSVVFGSLRIKLPPETGVVVSAELDAGEIRFNGRAVDQGINNESSIAYEGTGSIALDAHVGFGELVVDLVEDSP